MDEVGTGDHAPDEAGPPTEFDREARLARDLHVRRWRCLVRVYSTAGTVVLLGAILCAAVVGDVVWVVVAMGAVACFLVAFSLPYLMPATSARKRVGIGAGAGAWVLLLVFLGVWVFPR